MGAQATHPSAGLLKIYPEMTAECHARGIRVHPWTVDDPELIRYLWQIGVDAIITNKPDVAREALEACEAE
jgi:glycerophosphoryl diester phosphodiesterase